MTDREKAIVMAHTGICMLTGTKFAIFHKYVEDIMGRPVQTIEMGIRSVCDEIKERSKDDFIALCMEEEQCGDCISREAVLRINECHHGQMPNHVNFQIYEEIQALPSVSPTPKMGKWIVDDSYNVRNFGKAVYHYSVHCKDCGWHWDYSTDKEGSLPSNYCPNCGLKMEAQNENRRKDG
jgi:hypothetical protein